MLGQDVPSDDELEFLDEESAILIASHMRGITGATVQIIGGDSVAETELVAFLQALDILVDVVRIEQVAPPPRRRFSFRYQGRNARITVAPEAPLKD